MKELRQLKQNLSDEMSKKLDLSLCERIVKRFDEFTPECDECKRLALQFKDVVKELIVLKDEISKDNIKKFHEFKSEAISHLEKQHQLVPQDHYTGTFMSLGLSLGLVFGMAVFDNIGLGLPIGLAIGLAIGTSKDADAKKKGLVI